MVTSRLDYPTPAQPRLGAVRGAVTVEEDTPAAVDAAVHELLEQLIEANDIGACTQQITYGLVGRIGHGDRGQLACARETRQHDRIAAVGLDTFTWRFGDG